MILAVVLFASMVDMGDSIAINSACRDIRFAEGRANFAVFLSPDPETRRSEGERLRGLLEGTDPSLDYCIKAPWFETKPVTELGPCLDSPRMLRDSGGFLSRPWEDSSPPCQRDENGLPVRASTLDSVEISEISRERCLACRTEEDPRSAVSEWRLARAETGGRAPFLVRVLTSNNARVRQWGFKEIASDFDPRHWNPSEVAASIRALEIADAAATAAGMEVFAQGDDERAQDIWRRLARIGQLRVLEVAQPLQYVRLADGEPGRGSMHFPGELNLYAEEFVQQNGGIRSMPKIPKKELMAHLAKRWQETDRAAPHPDMEAVKKALEELRRVKQK